MRRPLPTWLTLYFAQKCQGSDHPDLRHAAACPDLQLLLAGAAPGARPCRLDALGHRHPTVAVAAQRPGGESRGGRKEAEENGAQDAAHEIGATTRDALVSA